MKTPSISFRILIGLFFVLAACEQKTETNPPEIVNVIKQQIAAAPRWSYLIGPNKNLSRLEQMPSDGKFVAQEGSINGKRHTVYVTLASKYVAKVVYPGSAEYAAYDYEFYGGKMLKNIYDAGQFALFIRNDGVIGRVSAPTKRGVIPVRWNDDWQCVSEDRTNLAPRLSRVIPKDDQRYDAYAGKYCRGEKAE